MLYDNFDICNALTFVVVEIICCLAHSLNLSSANQILYNCIRANSFMFNFFILVCSHQQIVWKLGLPEYLKTCSRAK